MSGSFVEQWKIEGTRCSSCGHPLWNRWGCMRYRLGDLRMAADCARRRKWAAAWFCLRKFRFREFVRGV